jgi:hypothetical protein
MTVNETRPSRVELTGRWGDGGRATLLRQCVRRAADERRVQKSMKIADRSSPPSAFERSISVAASKPTVTTRAATAKAGGHQKKTNGIKSNTEPVKCSGMGGSGRVGLGLVWWRLFT